MLIPSPLRIASLALRKYKSYKRRKNTEKRLGFDIKDRFYYPSSTLTSKRGRTYTVVSAVYGVEKYIDDMLASLLRQTLDFKKHIQVILVNDGSVDRSGEICEEWAARFPDNIKVIHKENGGQASARNAGLPHASGDWVGFVDPDDILSHDYFEQVDHALDIESNVSEIDFISCNYIKFIEDNFSIRDDHPLRFRFQHGKRLVRFDNSCDDIQLNVNSALFCRKKLQHSGVLFDNIRAKGEDALFVNRFLLSLDNPTGLYLPGAQYYYRKREDKTSTLDTSWLEPELYSVFPNLMLGLFNDARSRFSYIPRWLQRVALYHHAWEIKRFLNSFRNSADIPYEIRTSYVQLLKQVFNQIDPEIITSFELAGVNDVHRYAILSMGHSSHDWVTDPRVVAFDEKREIVQVRYYFTKSEHTLCVEVSGASVHPVTTKVRHHKFLGHAYVREYIA